MAVTFIHGANSRAVATAVGQTAGSIIPSVRKIMNVPAGATAEIDGEAIGNEYVFEDKDEVVFYKVSGSKGL